MTDNEIIKALECCKYFDDLRACYKCPALKKGDCSNGKVYISDFILDNALDLIKRQKQQLADDRAISEICAETISRQDAEIERLKEGIKFERERVNSIPNLLQQTKSEAIKEFADRVKCNASILCDKVTGLPCSYTISNYNFNLLLKEMVGDSDV